MTDFDKWYTEYTQDISVELSEEMRIHFCLAYRAGAASQAKSETERKVLELMEKHGDVSAYFSDSDDDFKNKSGILASSANLYDSICLGYAEGQRGRAEGGLASKMTLREHYAGQALAGDMATSDEGVFLNDVDDKYLVDRAMLLYRMADAMIVARNAPEGDGS
jgi:hypothetical protein